MELANERIHRNPLRYYVWLPTLRIADMWLRPRTEMLPLELALVGIFRRHRVTRRSRRSGAC